ncbi:4Fe-4S binding protein [Cohnella abietis]|uniref:Ferredoxin n=1 Tax=Cohnella abietis TaxID=2507935 RepID=A0A3T1DCU5_9BACL|nr:4Fe-4S binding protein [Cohnella abietis]BBI35913.1 ferredoxin [Cohnella abietis]
MIEILNESKCISCNQCVDICPTRVFDSVKDGVPIINRKDDCQTCFMCEAYCPVDALYVAPEAEESVTVDYNELEEAGLIGSYRSQIKWRRDKQTSEEVDANYHMLRLYFST